MNPRYLLASFLLLTSTLLAEPPTTRATARLTPDRASCVYSEGEPITFTLSATGASKATYQVRMNGKVELAKGEFDLASTSAAVTVTLDQPGWVYATAEVTYPDSKEPTKIAAGAIVEWKQIQTAVAAPDDFDAFWAEQTKRADEMALNAKLTPVDLGDPGVAYFQVEFDSLDGKRFRGQYARPAKPGKYPALLVLPWAGVYGLSPGMVTGRAKQGWIVMHVSVHDLPIDQPEPFYKDQAALKGYTAIGDTSRDTSYFLRMVTGCYRAAKLLSEQPEWDGKTFVANGNSQGGLLSSSVAALFPKTTHYITNVPAGCDTLSSLHDRMHAWPYWRVGDKENAEAIRNTSRYFDTANFAARVKVPALVSVGLIDITCPPTGVIGMFNQLKGPKELVIMPNAPHQNVNNSHQPFEKRSSAWLDAIRKGQDAPVQPNP